MKSKSRSQLWKWFQIKIKIIALENDFKSKSLFLVKIKIKITTASVKITSFSLKYDNYLKYFTEISLNNRINNYHYAFIVHFSWRKEVELHRNNISFFFLLLSLCISLYSYIINLLQVILILVWSQNQNRFKIDFKSKLNSSVRK